MSVIMYSQVFQWRNSEKTVDTTQSNNTVTFHDHTPVNYYHIQLG